MGVLSDLTVGDKAVLVALDLPENVQNHLMHMGFVPGAEVTALRRAPAGDPTVFGIDGMEIALRYETASAIQVHPVEVRPIEIRTPEARPAVALAAEIRPAEATTQPAHDSDVAPKLVEAAR